LESIGLIDQNASESWLTGRMASLTDLWNEINQPQVSSQLSLAF
jgi:hypothetical protein